MKVAQLLSSADLNKIAEAARSVEGRTSAEIVPYIVSQSDAYESPLWKGAAFGAVVVALIASVVHISTEVWGGAALAWTTLPTLLGALIGSLAVWGLPPLRRLLVGPATLEARVRRRAQVAFLEEEVFRTRARTGVLVFVSLFERRVVVLGDTGINAKVAPAEWDSVARDLALSLRTGQVRDGFVRAIEACGALLEKHGLAYPADDQNELADGVRTSDR